MTAPGEAKGRFAEPGFWGYSLGDLALGGAALFLLIAYVPDILRGSPVLLTTVVWPLGAVGLVSLALLAARGQRAARFAAAFLGWALVCVAFAPHPWQAWNAGWNGDRGWVYLAAYLGCWAIGPRRGTRTVRVVTVALVAGLLANVFVAYVQATTPNGRFFLALIDGRAAGLTANSVFLGALMSGGAALCANLAARTVRGPWAWGAWAVAAGLMAMAANLAGSRIAIVGVVVVGIAASWRGRSQWRRTVAVAAAIGLGLVAGAALLPSSGTTRAASTGSGSGGITNRLEMWNLGVRSWTERPLTGWGPNGFRDATEHRTTLKFAKAEGGGAVYPDGHNLAVETLVTTGLPGLVALGGFAWFAARRARGPLAWYALGVSLTWLLEPTAIETAPTALLALGLACVGGTGPPAEPAATDDDRPIEQAVPADDVVVPPDPPVGSVPGRVAVVAASAVLAVVALAGSLRLVYVDHLAFNVFDSLAFVERTRMAGEARDVLPHDPAVADVYTSESRILAQLDDSEASRRRWLAAADRALSLAPTRADLWVQKGLAVLNASGGSEHARIVRARPYFLRALELHPWFTPALNWLHKLDVELGRTEDAARWAAQLCQLDACPPPRRAPR